METSTVVLIFVVILLILFVVGFLLWYFLKPATTVGGQQPQPQPQPQPAPQYPQYPNPQYPQYPPIVVIDRPPPAYDPYRPWPVPGPRPYPPYPGPRPGIPGCRTNGECLRGQFCSKTGCSGTGRCADRPDVCTTNYLPVCTCNGQTRSNSCQAHRMGENVAYTGQCRMF